MKREVHWCWVAGRLRVERLGTVMDCIRCRRWALKHKCGMDPDYRTAWKKYPAEDCASCLAKFEKGKLPKAPAMKLAPVVAPRPVVPGKPNTAIVSIRTRYTQVRTKAGRKQILLIAAEQGAQTIKQFEAVLGSFGADVGRRSVGGYLNELIDEYLLMRHKVDRPNASKYAQRKWSWVYEPNQAVRERIAKVLS